jgi:hypothetical protein
MYDETLAFTGIGAITIGSLVLDIWWLAAVAVGILLFGIALTRLGRRGGRRWAPRLSSATRRDHASGGRG